MEDLIDEILCYRAAHNLTQGEFAKLANVSVGTIVKIEHGGIPTRLTAAKIRLFLKEAKNNG